MSSPGEPHAALRASLRGRRGVVLVIGGPDTGKTTFSKFVLADALGAGERVALVDADVDVSTVGPPACVGLRFVRTPEDIRDPTRPDELRFVGSTSPQGVVLPYVVAAAVLIDQARSQADLVLVDTAGTFAGVVGQTVLYHLAELCVPEMVVAMQRGNELEPEAQMLERFLGVRVEKEEPHPSLLPTSPVDRHKRRLEAFQTAFPEPLQRWRVQPTVFAPTLPEEFDLAKLDGMLVGIQDHAGRCVGLGAMEYVEGLLRVATAHGERMRGLRLGSMRIDLTTFETTRIRLRQLIFGI